MRPPERIRSRAATPRLQRGIAVPVPVRRIRGDRMIAPAPAPAAISPGLALDVAGAIGFRIARCAIWHEDHCTWFDTTPTMPGTTPPNSGIGYVSLRLADRALCSVLAPAYRRGRAQGRAGCRRVRTTEAARALRRASSGGRAGLSPARARGRRSYGNQRCWPRTAPPTSTLGDHRREDAAYRLAGDRTRHVFTPQHGNVDHAVL